MIITKARAEELLKHKKVLIQEYVSEGKPADVLNWNFQKAIEARADMDEICAALAESVKLQSHYASLLNIHDGGQRLTFDSAEAWIKRLRDLKEGVAHG